MMDYAWESRFYSHPTTNDAKTLRSIDYVGLVITTVTPFVVGHSAANVGTVNKEAAHPQCSTRLSSQHTHSIRSTLCAKRVKVTLGVSAPTRYPLSSSIYSPSAALLEQLPLHSPTPPPTTSPVKMKLYIILTAYLLTLVSARVARPWVGDLDVSTAADERPLYLPYPYATDDYYITCKCKGENFWKAMHSSAEDAGKLFKPTRESSESIFTDTDALTTWSWQDSTVPASSYQFDKAWGFDHVLRAIHVSDQATKNGGSIEVFKITHGDGDANGGGYGPTPYNQQPEYTVDGKNYRVTGGEYTFGFDPSGVILALDRKSAQFAGNQRNPKVQGEGVPALQSFSDIAWLKWKATTGNVPSSMRYFASLSITNLETRGIISKVLNMASYTEVPAWPGFDVDANTEQGAALLGTPNAIAFSYLLVQHKASLGHLKISKITLFKNSMKFADPCMLFHVEQVLKEDMASVVLAQL
ncbi:hypothetical protein OPT61_g8742 [Boeremia exigua]|uniref:Uncharacterized protein n=1 Tax=Boeremia exigua TaxID=749465 RepID=A0ACC2HX04_9PLEO|nr:hypothetical protein OPT61_g8742 [Boeremia exigua]